MIKALLRPFRKHPLKRGNPCSDEKIEELRRYNAHLDEQKKKTKRQIDELMVQRIREAGLGA